MTEEVDGAGQSNHTVHADVNLRGRMIPMWVALVAIFVLGVPVVIGFWRLEQLVNSREHDRRVFESFVIGYTLSNCQAINSGHEFSRDADRRQYEDIAAINPSNEGLVDAMTMLIERIPTPESQDQDCNKNGDLDPGDYLPDT